MSLYNSRRIKVNQVHLYNYVHFLLSLKISGTEFRSLAALTRNDWPPLDSRLKRPWRLFRFFRFYWCLDLVVSGQLSYFMTYCYVTLINLHTTTKKYSIFLRGKGYLFRDSCQVLWGYLSEKEENKISEVS